MSQQDRDDSGAEAPETTSLRPLSVPDPLIGRTINGRFKVVSVIARGGMGKVYRAEQAPLGRICALKVLSPNYEGDGDPEFHKRFFLEAATAAKLNHPNTVTIFDYGKDESEDIYYIAMEYIEGKTLYRVLREDGAFDEARTGHIARQICRSLREAHKLGVVHRDLKPANILLTNREDERDSVKVLDFGLVKDVTGNNTEDLTQAGLFMGSPKYMSPEQITGGAVGPGTDVYSLGVMLFEMLAGKVPFDRGKSVATLMAHVSEPAPRLADVRPGIAVSAAMEGIVYRCLEKSPDARFASMDELLVALKQIGHDSWQTETHEALPAAFDPLAVSGSGPASASGPLGLASFTPRANGMPHTPSATPTGTPSASLAGLQSPRPGALPSSPALDPDLVPRPSAFRRALPVLITVALGVGVGAFVLAGRPEPPAPTPAAAATSEATSETPKDTPTSAPSQAATVAPTSSGTEPAATAEPTTRILHVQSDPPGATVTENGKKLCSPTPCDVTFPADDKGTHKLSLDKQGYRTEVLTVHEDDTTVKTNLDLATAPRVAPAVTKPVAPQGGGNKSGKPDDYKPSPY